MTTLALQSEGPSAKPPSILLLDDRPENLRVIEAVLSGLDVTLLFATSGSEALELFDGHELAAAVLDVCMPGMDGFEVAMRMRSRGHAVPIIFVTALDRSEESMMRAYSIGSADFLYKPLEPHVLRAKVQVFLDLFRLRQVEKVRARELEALYESLVQKRAEAENMASELALQKAELERRNCELSLRNSQLDSFTHVVSHDLRQPLGSIQDYIELIETSSGERLNATTLRWIKSCRRLGQNMQSLIENILEYSRLGGQPPALSRVDANTVLANALDSLHATVKESGALITSDMLPAVLGSERLLTCLFENLIGNAIKYRGTEPPTVQVSHTWHDSEQKWCFEIADNGRGFDGGDSERLFEMFGRGENVGDIPGTGIGLAVCKRIVEAHGGRIWAKSESGQGSAFLFVLPDAGQAARYHVVSGK